MKCSICALCSYVKLRLWLSNTCSSLLRKMPISQRRKPLFVSLKVRFSDWEMQQPGGLTPHDSFPASSFFGAEQKRLWLNFPPLPFFSAEQAHLVAQKLCEELKHKMSTTEAHGQSQCLKMTAEIDDLNRTKAILEERLIELIRYGLPAASTDINFVINTL